MWPRKNRSLFERSQELESEKLNQELQIARAGLQVVEDRKKRDEKEKAHRQMLFEDDAKKAFSKNFDAIPEIIGYVPDAASGLNGPVFSVEQANVIATRPADKYHRKLSNLIEMGTRPTDRSSKKNFEKMAHIVGFELGGVCTGCGEYACLSKLNFAEDFYPITFTDHISVKDRTDLARNLELVDSVASGLVLSCETVSVFGFEEVDAAIMCQAFREILNAENERRAASSQNQSTKTSRQERDVTLEKLKSARRRRFMGR